MKVKNGIRYEKNGWIYISIKGSPRERGYAHGYLTVKEIQDIDPEHQISDVVRKSIQSVNGNRDINFIDEYVKYSLRSGDSKKLRQYMAQNMYGFDYNIEFEGENKDTFTTRFPIGPEILWV